MSDLIQILTRNFEHLGSFIYLITFVVVFAESVIVIGHFLPGTLFIAFMGFLCYLNVYDLGTMFLVVFLGHYGGEISNYYLGRTKGHALFSPQSRFLKPSLLDKVERQFQEGGVKILLLSQFVGLIRPVVGFVAGMVRYPARRFLLVAAVADLLWSLLHLGLGFILGASWQHAEKYIGGFSLIVIIVALVFWFSGWLIRTLLAHAGELGAAIELASGRIRRSEHYLRLAGRHSRLFAFLEARLSLTRAWGIRATIGWLISLVLLLHFADVMHGVLTNPGVRQIDLSLLNLLSQMRNPVADRLLQMISCLSNSRTVLAVLTLAGVAELWARQFKSFAVILGSVLLALALSPIMAAINLQARPEAVPALLQADRFGFSSTPSAVAVAVFCSLYFWLWNHPGRLRLRALLAFVVVVFILLTGFSGLYFGIRFPTDAMGGFSLGLVCVVLIGTWVQNISALRESRRRADLSALLVILVGIGVAGVSYVKAPAVPPPRIIQPRAAVTVQTVAELITRLPRQANNLANDPMVPLNVVLIGDPARLVRRLESRGWTPVAPEAFLARQIRAPIFPCFVHGVPAEATLQKKTDNARRILRFWRADETLDGAPVWVGNVAQERIERHIFGILTYELSDDLDAAADRLAAETGGLAPQSKVPFRERGIYGWKHPFFTHGQALVLNLADPRKSR